MSDDDRSGSEDESQHVPEVVAHIQYELNKETEVPGTNGKLHKTLLVEGTANTHPPKGSKVSVHYVGTLLDGSKFDSSRDRGELFEFDLGKGAVIKGWDVGVATMNKGEKALLKCHPDFAYGSREQGKIPANSTLVFEVELFDWTKDEDISRNKDKSLVKSIIVEGKDWDKPDYESQVTVDYRDSDDNARENFTFTLGEENGLPANLEEAITTMKKGEECVVTDRTTATPQTLRITLRSFEKVKTWEYKGLEKVHEATKRKDQGNNYFKTGDLERAERKYKRALEFIEYDYGLNDDEKTAARSVKIPVYNNLAQVFITKKNFQEAINHCNKCLEVNSTNIKALFRRGKAHNALDNWEEAKTDLNQVLSIDAGNTEAALELESVNNKIRSLRAKEKALFGNMFEKMNKMEAREHNQ